MIRSMRKTLAVLLLSTVVLLSTMMSVTDSNLGALLRGRRLEAATPTPEEVAAKYLSLVTGNGPLRASEGPPQQIVMPEMVQQPPQQQPKAAEEIAAEQNIPQQTNMEQQEQMDVPAPQQQQPDQSGGEADSIPQEVNGEQSIPQEVNIGQQEQDPAEAQEQQPDQSIGEINSLPQEMVGEQSIPQDINIGQQEQDPAELQQQQPNQTGGEVDLQQDMAQEISNGEQEQGPADVQEQQPNQTDGEFDSKPQDMAGEQSISQHVMVVDEPQMALEKIEEFVEEQQSKKEDADETQGSVIEPSPETKQQQQEDKPEGDGLEPAPLQLQLEEAQQLPEQQVSGVDTQQQQSGESIPEAIQQEQEQASAINQQLPDEIVVGVEEQQFEQAQEQPPSPLAETQKKMDDVEILLQPELQKDLALDTISEEEKPALPSMEGHQEERRQQELVQPVPVLTEVQQLPETATAQQSSPQEIEWHLTNDEIMATQVLAGLQKDMCENPLPPPLPYDNCDPKNPVNSIDLYGGLTNALKMILLGAIKSFEEERCFIVDESKSQLNPPDENGVRHGFMHRYMEQIGLPLDHPLVESAKAENRLLHRDWSEFWMEMPDRRAHGQMSSVPRAGYGGAMEGHDLKRAMIRRLWRPLPKYIKSSCDAVSNTHGLTAGEYIAFSVRRGDKTEEKFAYTELADYINEVQKHLHRFESFMKHHEVPKIFVATDDCSVMPEFRSMRPHWTFVSECDVEQNSSAAAQDGFALRDVKQWGEEAEDAHFTKFFAEVYALTFSKVFIGVGYTNVSWWVYFLRPFRHSFVLLDKPEGRTDIQVIDNW